MTSSAAEKTWDASDQLARRAAETPGIISFAGGLPDPAMFPKRQLAQAFVAALQLNGGAALQYGWQHCRLLNGQTLWLRRFSLRHDFSTEQLRALRKHRAHFDRRLHG